MSYEIVTADSLMSLTQSVNARIRNGWLPLGGPVATWDKKGNGALLQAMTFEPR